MPRMPIDFRELLERVLPLEELAAPDRAQIQRALRSGMVRQVEAAAMMAIERLELGGALRRVAADEGTAVRRWLPRGSGDVITLEVPAASERDGVVAFPRAGLPGDAAAGLDQVRRLLRLDDAVFADDPALPDARAAQLQQLDQAGRELLRADRVRFLAPPGQEGADREQAVDTALAAEALARPGAVLHCPDVTRHPRLALVAEPPIAGVAWCAVVGSEGVALGVLEACFRADTRLDARDLARFALLADAFGTVLERAARIEKLVFVDPLTGSYNRSYFELQARNEIARAQREEGSMALCIADVDNFKSFNSTYGYDAGNHVLVNVAQTLRRGVRPFDTVARWGGEEFAVLLTAPLDEGSVRAISERLRVAVERLSLRLEGLDGLTYATSVTVSIGVALSPRHGRTVQDLWRSANQALLEAKRRQKNRVVFPGGTE
ncbi:MAG: diguanylate cyclase [Candidatus Eisenbacteria bacterium]